MSGPIIDLKAAKPATIGARLVAITDRIERREARKLVRELLRRLEAERMRRIRVRRAVTSAVHHDYELDRRP